MGTYYHFTSYNHMLEIAASGKIKLTCSNLLYPTNPRIVNGALVSDTDDYKPVVWLTNKDTSDGLGVDPITRFKPVDDDKRRIRITIESGTLIVKKWLSWAYHNHMDAKWRDSLIKGQDYKTWYITETDIPVANITRIEDVYSGIDYSIQEGQLIENSHSE